MKSAFVGAALVATLWATAASHRGGHKARPYVTAAISSEDGRNALMTVVDGDTVRDHGILTRLVGFDAPETFRAKCQSERDLGMRATARLRQFVARRAELTAVACACLPGTEGTMACNYGRACAVLRVTDPRDKDTDGPLVDVAAIMIHEGLARPYVCGATRCPRRAGWCQ